MMQLKELQAQLEHEGQGVAEDPYPAPMEEEEEALFDTPPTLQPKDTGMTPMMKKLSLELQEANVEREELKRQNLVMLEETQKLFLQIQQQGKQQTMSADKLKEGALSAEELQKKLDQDKLRRKKQLDRARATVAKEQLAEMQAQETLRSTDRERSPRKNGDSQTSVRSFNSLT